MGRGKALVQEVEHSANVHKALCLNLNSKYMSYGGGLPEILALKR